MFKRLMIFFSAKVYYYFLWDWNGNSLNKGAELKVILNGGVAGQEGSRPPALATTRVTSEIFINLMRNFCRRPRGYSPLPTYVVSCWNVINSQSGPIFFLQKMLYMLQLLGYFVPQTTTGALPIDPGPHWRLPSSDPKNWTPASKTRLCHWDLNRMTRTNSIKIIY